MSGTGGTDAPVAKIGRFSNEIQLHNPERRGNLYRNPWTTWQDHTYSSMLSFFRIAATEMSKTGVPSDPAELEKALPVLTPEFSYNSSSFPPRVTWIGHATVLLQMDGVTVLADPIFSQRCSPVQWMGTKRYRPAACSVAELPEVNAVVISHNHYDHLDYNSVKQLNARFDSSLRWYVPQGTKSWMESCGCKNVIEMNWWEEDRLPGTDVIFALTPSQHWCKRGLFDNCKQLWGSWCIIGPRSRFFFGGDTGYCEGFKQIGQIYGPFDLAAIPIGAYEPRWFMQFAHCNPEEAVKIHQDIKSRKSIAIHWGTFTLTTENYLEPPQRLKDCLEEQKISLADFCVLKHGESAISDVDPNQEN